MASQPEAASHTYNGFLGSSDHLPKDCLSYGPHSPWVAILSAIVQQASMLPLRARTCKESTLQNRIIAHSHHARTGDLSLDLPKPPRPIFYSVLAILDFIEFPSCLRSTFTMRAFVNLTFASMALAAAIPDPNLGNEKRKNALSWGFHNKGVQGGESAGGYGEGVYIHWLAETGD
ncbi:uncharacterized protein MYCFIDRAFT_174824 [Pseudocercospora fijiensis CIRAD86]|uniref:Uncharacterized protein n=1 Tax=Pseudocercospora fijiensis (strain CIRAD86) TaxID=383855 RepID=M2Z0K6_PSEFD|nr:uncharacterized protein MYCFIDRAFT_174824 [Pseudocercospora fijiensis CIRAD86]EME83375.1 hypothetical protein MYCFIDRAFT_174824 [Pseudocercospora fijiensis CIRAD86]